MRKKSSALPFIGKGGKDKLAGECVRRSGKLGAWALARRCYCSTRRWLVRGASRNDSKGGGDGGGDLLAMRGGSRSMF